MAETGLNAAALQQELQEVEEAIRTTPDPATRTLLHRDAAYSAMDLGDFPLAMTHAVTGLDTARGTHDLSLQARAHVTIALVMAEVYDDQGAGKHLREAEDLSRLARDPRGVALANVNASHYEMERRQYEAATRRLLDLLRSPYVSGLIIPDPRVGPELQQSFHVNYVKSASRALDSRAPFGERQAEVEQQLEQSVAFLHELYDGRRDMAVPRILPEVLDALASDARYHQDWERAQAYADERVDLSQRGGIDAAIGRALHSRAELAAQRGDWAAVIGDARQAAQLFGEAGQELRAVDAWQLVADALAQLGHDGEAFRVQRELTSRAAGMYRAFLQQSAQLRLIEQQAQAAEVRAVAMAEAALSDPLTGIPNRTAAMQRLHALHQAAADGKRSSAALLDIDLFKRVNDHYGHAAGDEVLRGVAAAVQAAIRDTDSLARIGGEEFLLLFPGLTADEALGACERVTQTVSQLSWPGLTPDFRVTVSIGVADIRGDETPSDTLRKADQAMYGAKAAGRDTVLAAL
ncbi:sensor domain-containing diguanylate cyclase [Deinococcus navajonensis]|uniref:Diguanylate cyclase n=1 Tax=Deinococcus navajonensis TaxID=309884 RepID=A0ABV8XK83_9DEIO